MDATKNILKWVLTNNSQWLVEAAKAIAKAIIIEEEA
jgi:hypothetical protein